jgi:hypothetical protein
LRPGGVGQFAIKVCIVAAVISISTMFVANWIIDSAEFAIRRTANDLRSQYQGVGSVGGRPFWTAVEHELEQAASPDRDMPAEKKQKLIAELHTIAVRWRPFIDALSVDPQQTASNPAACAK